MIIKEGNFMKSVSFFLLVFFLSGNLEASIQFTQIDDRNEATLYTKFQSSEGGEEMTHSFTLSSEEGYNVSQVSESVLTDRVIFSTLVSSGLYEEVTSHVFTIAELNALIQGFSDRLINQHGLSGDGYIYFPVKSPFGGGYICMYEFWNFVELVEDAVDTQLSGAKGVAVIPLSNSKFMNSKTQEMFSSETWLEVDVKF